MHEGQQWDEEMLPPQELYGNIYVDGSSKI